MKYNRITRAAVVFGGITALSSPALSDNIVIGIMEGYEAFGFGNPEDIANLNSSIRDQLRGENYFSRIFQWDAVDEATNYFNLFPNSQNYLIGYSRGGYQALRVANNLDQQDKNIKRLVQLDPVRCGGTGTYAADNVAGCAALSINDVVSSGPQIVPDNVEVAKNFFQTGGGITGERNVTGSENINANIMFGDASINHSTIDGSPDIRDYIVSDLKSLADNNVIMSGLGGDAGYGTLAMTRNDDGSSSEITLPFSINLNGNIYDRMFINNNGNVTFGDDYRAFTPTGFSNLPVDMIAPYWGDVDTRCADCGEVYLAVPTADTAVVTWNEVGFYAADASKKNTFQLIIRDRNDLVGDNTDVEFRYGQLEWTTGDASGGANGLGGTPAFAGYTGGPNGAPQTLIGSGTSSVLTLNSRSNISNDGVWYFPFRDGMAPGVTPDNPLLPDVQDGNWEFQFVTTDVTQVVWSDPEFVFGYDFVGLNGTLFRSVIFPILGDNAYSLWFGALDDPIYFADVIGGVEYLFADMGFLNGVDFFRVEGVDLDLMLDPNDVNGFVTGLSFMNTGLVEWSQRPLVVQTSEPPIVIAMLMLSGIAGIMTRRRRKDKRHKNEKKN
ncbi:MAG: hypothetical protein KDC18_00550 [Alphaproteobacteria bacterium]|nr:hypothetical protein [Alphaproteobacteria bacterium]MCB9929057.1 hypothetical protein [Alphaproteobacteria bacterium]